MDGRRTIGLVGAGNIAEALLAGWIASGLCSPDAISVSDVRPERLEELRQRHGVKPFADNASMVAACDVVVLSVKPQVAEKVLAAIAGTLTARHLVVSVAAGVTIAAIEAAAPSARRVIRTMPNTPALVAAGATGIAAGAGALPDDIAFAERMFQAVGLTAVVPETMLDAVTGLSGSGPAYVMMFIEALADGGVRSGLPRDVAQRLACQTVLGSAKLLLETGEHPGVLKDRVTSPGGTTIAGVAALERGGFRSAVIDAVSAATARAAELGRR